MKPAWETLTDAFSRAINGRRVTHALFTTYTFDPAFFETAIIPAMLPNAEGLSDNSGLRRLQLEQILRNDPIVMTVFFDARREPPAFPWLPYQAVPVSIGSAFHGKVVILRLEEEKRQIRWVLGAGSANLTRAGWWENIELFKFSDDFDPKAPPEHLLPDLGELLDFLADQIAVGGKGTAGFLQGELGRKPGTARRNPDRFGVFLPGKTRFTEWLNRHLASGRGACTAVEVISPYFPATGHASLVEKLLRSTGAGRVNLWLPEDRWQSANGTGNAVRIEKDDYHALSGVNRDGRTLVSWCRFAEQSLHQEATPDDVSGKPPRFLHAKMIRVPGRGVFIGSVNFSHDAFDNNFEAGFLLPDRDDEWLAPVGPEYRAERFLAPEAENLPHGADDQADLLRFAALYHWGSKTFSLTLLDLDPSTVPLSRVGVVNAAGRVIVTMALDEACSCFIESPEQRESLEKSLAANPRLRVEAQCLPEPVPVWVQQEGLEFRPLPVEITLDVWKMLEIWRGLKPGAQGSSPCVWEGVRTVLPNLADFEGVDTIPPQGQPQDIFQEIAAIHSSMHLLRSRIREAGDERTLGYYLSAERPDTLATLLKRLEEPGYRAGCSAPDPVQLWVILHWAKLISADHQKHPAAAALTERADSILERLFQDPVMKPFEDGENRRWLDWVSARFLKTVGREAEPDQGGTQ